MAALKKKGMPPIADRITLPWPRRAHCDAAIDRGLDQRQVGPTADVVAEPLPSFWPISGVCEVVVALFWSEGLEGCSDSIPEGGDGALGGLAQVSFEFCEGLLDRIEIGRIGG